MKPDVARQPIVPAFLTLALLVAAAMTCAAVTVGPGGMLRGEAPDGPLPLLPAAWIEYFAAQHPVWTRVACGFALLYAGLAAGRLGARYNLYAAGTCLAVPLFGIAACGAVAEGFRPGTLAASVLLMLAMRCLCRSFTNGYAFDAMFRASLLLSLMVLCDAAAMPLLALLPLAVVSFRRTMRECVVALAGLLLPPLVCCYVGWAMGAPFLEPMTALAEIFTFREALGAWRALGLGTTIFLGSIAALDGAALLMLFADFYAVGSKSRHLLLFIIGVLLLTVGASLGPGAGDGAFLPAAVPTALLLPFLFVRIRRDLAALVYVLLLGGAVYAILQ